MAARHLVLVCGFLIFIVQSSNGAATQPKGKPVSTFFNICPFSERRELGECMRKSMTEARPLFKKGIPSLGLVPIEPMVIPKMEFVEGSGSFALKTTLKNFVIHGFGAYEISYVDVDWKSMTDGTVTPTINISMTLPELNMTADYEMDGRILVIPIQGNGNCEMFFTNLVTVGTVRGRTVTRDGRDYLDILKVTWDIKFNGKRRMWFYNLFNGDERLGAATNSFLNENSVEASNAFKYLPEEAFGELVRDLAKKVFDIYPLQELFPGWA